MTTARADATSGPTPIPISRRTRTTLFVVGFIVALLLLRAMPSVPRLFLGGATLALLLSFPVRLLARFMRRGIAILLTGLTVLLALVLALVFLVPIVVEQLIEVIDALPQSAAEVQQAASDLLKPLRDAGILPAEPTQTAARWGQGLIEQLREQVAAALAGLLNVVSGAIGGIVHGFIMFLVSIYLLVDYQRIKAAVLRLAPARYQGDAETLWVSIGASVSRYLGGLAFSMAEQGTLVAIGAWLIGIPYAVLLGVIFGLTACIPYLGAWLGAIPLVLIALLSGGWVTGLLALGLTFLVNGFDSNIVQPRVQGKALNVHPIVIMLAVIGGGELAGPLGAVFALPVIGILRVTADFFAARLAVQTPGAPVALAAPGTTGDAPVGAPRALEPPPAMIAPADE